MFLLLVGFFRNNRSEGLSCSLLEMIQTSSYKVKHYSVQEKQWQQSKKWKWISRSLFLKLSKVAKNVPSIVKMNFDSNFRQHKNGACLS